MKSIKLFFIVIVAFTVACNSSKTVWTIGVHDGSATEFALGGNDFSNYIASDFGFEDRYFLVGHSKESKDFQYALPGPVDAWGGTWGNSCWVTHDINILFPLKGRGLSSRTDKTVKISDTSTVKCIIDILGVSSKGSLLKIAVNGLTSKKYGLVPGTSDTLLYGVTGQSTPISLEFDFPSDCLYEGGNTITISILEGGWVIFDDLRLEASSSIKLADIPSKAYLRSVSVADYETQNSQPLLVDVEHLSGNPEINVTLDGEDIFKQIIDTSRYVFEAPMPAVTDFCTSKYEIAIDGKVVEKGMVSRNACKKQTLADYVDTKMGSGHSRWMIAPGPWMPFSMVKISPDNQNTGWQSGYQPSFETIGCFSHIHEWTMTGLGVMPTNGSLFIHPGDQAKPDEGYRSRIDKFSEKATLGRYRVFMEDTRIHADITATTRASLMKFVFPDSLDGRIMVDMHIPTEYEYQLKEVELKQVSDTKIEGVCHQLTPHVWSSDADQDYTIHFVMEFDQKIKKVGCWMNDSVMYQPYLSGKDLKDAGMFLEFATSETGSAVCVRTGISFVSLKNAEENLLTEISEPFGWNFEAVVQNQKDVWNDILSRVEIKTSDRLEKIRFYTNLFRSHCRNTFNDVNGEWITPDENVAHLSSQDDYALGCDAFWNTFWNLNQVWNLITPEWSSRWVRSQLALYDASGWLSKGPAGMQYIPVMVAEHEIAQVVSAYQMGIRDFDAEKLFTAVKKMQTSPARKVKGGFVGNRDLVHYLKYHYVPYELGTFSNSLEYSYDDWVTAQFAKSLGKEGDFKVFSDRGTWWKNTFNKENGYAHIRDAKGNFVEPFDPFKSYFDGRTCYTEGNAWQLSYFVPQDPLGMIETIGKDMFLDHLQWGFSESEKWRFNSPNERYDAYPVVQGNQQSMHFAFLFNWAGKPWLTQKWTRSIIDRYYGYGTGNAYLGDEDQGQMSAWFVMAALGLFQTDGGCAVNPYYEIASPLYEETIIHLGGRYGRGEDFVIKANGVSRNAKYVQSAKLNGKQLDSFRFPASELLKGGVLELEMGTEPNTQWGILKH